MTSGLTGLVTITVTGKFADLSDRPANGHVLLEPVNRVAGQGWIVVGTPVRMHIKTGQATGLMITNQAALSGDLYIRVTEQITGERPQEPPYVVKPEGTALDLTTAPRVFSPPPGQTFVPASALGQPGGVATLGQDGILTLSQRPAGGGGGATSHHELEDLADGDDHPQYLTPARGDVRYPDKTTTENALAAKEPLGAAAAAVAGHVAQADPHAQYLNNARGDARYVQPAQLAAVATTGNYADMFGTVPTSALPALAITDVFTVGSQAEMLALPAQRGDVAIRPDIERAFILAADNPAVLANWKQLPVPAGGVVSVNGQVGVVVLGKADIGLGNVADLAPADLPISDDTQAALDQKLSLSLIDAAGDLIIGSGADTAARLPKGPDGSALSVVGGAVAWAPAGDLYPPSAYGLTEWTTDIKDCSADFGHNNGVLLMMRFRYRGTATLLSEIGFIVTSAASDPGAFSGVALYEDGTGSVDLLGQSANTGTAWISTGLKSVPLSAPAAVVPGQFYRAAILWQGSSAGRIAGQPLVISDEALNAVSRRSSYLTGQSGFPAAIDVSSMITNNAIYWLGMK